MKLFLASEAKHPDTIKKIDEFVGGLKKRKIAYIVTAANGDGWGSWKKSETLKLLKKAGADVEIIQLEDYWKGEIPPIDDKEVVWFAGGQPGYLMYWIRRIKFEPILRKLLKEGVVYVGSSAGSMIAAKSLAITEWYIGEQEPGAGIIPGLGLIDFEIYPHYDDLLYENIKKKYKGRKLYLLKNGEGIIVEDNKIVVVGEERIITNNE